jgi:hypothetical protein
MEYRITFHGEFQGTMHEAFEIFHSYLGVTGDYGDIQSVKDGDKTTLFMDGVGLTVTYEPVTEDGEERN